MKMCLVMPTDEWEALCATVRDERQAYFADSEDCECFDDAGVPSGRVCLDCAVEALERAPAHYRRPASEVANLDHLDTLPGLRSL